MKHFIVTFDVAVLVSRVAFHNEFVSHPQITNWWHYLNGTYIVATTLSAPELSNHYRACATECGVSQIHFAAEINLTNSQGFLVPDAWNWLNRARAQNAGLGEDWIRAAAARHLAALKKKKE